VEKSNLNLVSCCLVLSMLVPSIWAICFMLERFLCAEDWPSSLLPPLPFSLA
jgi:hypothetical protein